MPLIWQAWILTASLQLIKAHFKGQFSSFRCFISSVSCLHLLVSLFFDPIVQNQELYKAFRMAVRALFLPVCRLSPLLNWDGQFLITKEMSFNCLTFILELSPLLSWQQRWKNSHLVPFRQCISQAAAWFTKDRWHYITTSTSEVTSVVSPVSTVR